MILDELAKLVQAIAKQMRIPLVKIGVFDEDRSMDFRTSKRPKRISNTVPHVLFEVQADGGMKLGKGAIALPEIVVDKDKNVDLIKHRLTQAAADAGVTSGISHSTVG